MARHCGHCWGRGHNKRTCPQMTESFLRRYKSASDESKEFYGAELMKRGINPKTGNPLTAKEKKATPSYAKQARRCTYCDEGGHNARTCEAKKSDIAIVNEAAKEFRIAVVERLKSEEFPGKGALMRYHSPREWMGSRDGYCPVNEIHMVTGINWERVTFDAAFAGTTAWLTMINLAAPGTSRHASQQAHWRIDKELRNNAGRASESGWAGLSNPPEDNFVEPPPAWWNVNRAGTDDCRLIVKSVKRNRSAMKLFAAILAAVKDGRDIDMTAPRLWLHRLDELGLSDDLN